VEIKEDTISKIETQLKELDSVADTSKYYIASEKSKFLKKTNSFV
jgi:hypothetical protein